MDESYGPARNCSREQPDNPYATKPDSSISPDHGVYKDISCEYSSDMAHWTISGNTMKGRPSLWPAWCTFLGFFVLLPAAADLESPPPSFFPSPSPGAPFTPDTNGQFMPAPHHWPSGPVHRTPAPIPPFGDSSAESQRGGEASSSADLYRCMSFLERYCDLPVTLRPLFDEDFQHCSDKYYLPSCT